MKYDVEYELDNELKKQIATLKDSILMENHMYGVYLFGSIAKGRYSKSSDIDILVLINDDKDLKELRRIRHFLEDKIEELLLDRDVDIKVYSRNRFLELTAKPSFESAIMKDLIDLRGW